MTDTRNKIVPAARACVPGIAGVTLLATAIHEYPRAKTRALALVANAIVAFAVMLIARAQERHTAALGEHLRRAERAERAQESFLRLIQTKPGESGGGG